MRRVTDRKIAETPQPIYVMKVRMVAWTRLVRGSLERSCEEVSARVLSTIRTIIGSFFTKPMKEIRKIIISSPAG